ncbi:MAG: OmpA family protein [Bdellovibrionales bacterium]|nr:OmpA family protein [Bdellovibrionales bacterium]
MARKRREEEHESHDRWLVSYADFITLLFAFFTVLYATSERDVKKQKEFEDSIKSAMTPMSESSQLLTDNSVNSSDAVNPIESPIENHSQTKRNLEELEEQMRKDLEKTLGEEQYKSTVQSIHHDKEGVRVTLSSELLFPSGSDRIREESLETISALADALKKTSGQIVVEGHTDNQPIGTSKFPSNWDLAAARSTMFVRFLISKHKIPAARIQVAAFADQRPIANNDSAGTRSQNRRIEVLLVPPVPKVSR